jgi:hypothetical protein
MSVEVAGISQTRLLMANIYEPAGVSFTAICNFYRIFFDSNQGELIVGINRR